MTRPICSETRTCWSIVNPPPPSSVGMFIADRPSSLAFCDVRLVDVVGDRALVLLGVDLPRDQLLVDEPSGALLELAVLGV